MTSGIQDLWYLKDGETPSKRHNRGLRFRVRHLGRTKSFRTKGAAEKYWRDITADDAVRPSGVTVQELLDKWKAGKQGLSPRGYRACLDAAAVCQPIAGRAAQGVTRPELQQWLAELTVTVRQRDGEAVKVVTRPASASTRQKARRALHGAFQIGVDTGVVKVNPASKLRVPRERPRDPQFLSTAELQRVAATTGHFEPLVLLLGTTGLRIGEACALNVGDVDVQRRRLWVRSAVAKSRRGREVPVPATVLALLDLDRPAWDPLFMTPNGARVERHNLSQRVWRPIAPDGMRLHDLRHTAASLAIASGADVKAVQRMLGHASAAMTLDRYGHLWDQGLDDVAARMDGLLSA